MPAMILSSVSRNRQSYIWEYRGNEVTLYEWCNFRLRRIFPNLKIPHPFLETKEPHRTVLTFRPKPSLVLQLGLISQGQLASDMAPLVCAAGSGYSPMPCAKKLGLHV